MTLVTVMRDRYVQGWPKHPHGERVYLLELGEALERSYSTDAHFTAYTTPNGRRLRREALDQGVSVELPAIFFDFDCPTTHGSKEPAPESWRRELREKVCRLFDAQGAGFYYETKGGARVVYRQEEPSVIASHEDALEWSRGYVVLVANLKRRFGLDADPSCKDWQRLFRAPRATRTPGGKPENWPTFGDPACIADLFIEATAEDVEAAKRASKDFRTDRSRNLEAPGAVVEGLLPVLLRMRGELGSAADDGWICLCPNRAQHTVKTDGTDTTIVYPARDGGELGAIHCLHAHCQSFAPKDWLGFFSDAEKDYARERAGIARRRAA